MPARGHNLFELFGMKPEDLIAAMIADEVARLQLDWWMLTFMAGDTWGGSIIVWAFGLVDAGREAGWRGCDGLVDLRRMSGVRFDRMRADIPRELVNRLLISDLERQRAEEWRA